MAMPFRTIWRARNSSSLTPLIVLVLSYLLSFNALCEAQYFDPDVDDAEYLNKIAKNIESEVNKTRVVFYKQAQVLDHITRQYIAAQLKENIFIALRVLAEKEIAEIKEKENEETTTQISLNSSSSTLKSYSRVKRQDDGDDDGDDGGDAGGAGAAAAGGIPNRPTIPPQIGLFPQVANLVRVIFGGNGQVNLTNYVASASKLLPRPLGNQVLGVVKILTNANGNGNRNSFTTANPLLAGLPPDLKTPALSGITQEQLVALGFPTNALGGLNLNGLTPEQLNLLGLGNLPGAAGTATTPDDTAGQIAGIPPGLTAADIAALAALGVPDLPNLQHLLETTKAPPPRSTRKPRPSYSPHNKVPSQQRPQEQSQQQQVQSHQQSQSQQQQLLSQQQQFKPQQQQFQPQHQQFQPHQQQFQPQQQQFQPQQQQFQPPQQQFQQSQQQQQFQPQQQQFQNQQLLSPQLELPVFVPTQSPNLQNYGQNFIQNQNPQFVGGDKDILPLNLNPNKQSLSQIQQQLHAQPGIKYKETPQSPSNPAQLPVFGSPSSNINLPPANDINQLQGTGGNSYNQHPQQQNQNYQPQQPSNGFGQQLNQKLQQQQNGGNYISGIGDEQNNIHSPSAGGRPSNQRVKPQQTTGGKTRRPQTPFQQQQAQLLAEQLQQLQQLEKETQTQETPIREKPTRQQQRPQQQSQFQQPPIFPPKQTSNFQQQINNQQNFQPQQQTQQFQPRPNPNQFQNPQNLQPQQQQKPPFQQQQQQNSQFQQQLQNPQLQQQLQKPQSQFQQQNSFQPQQQNQPSQQNLFPQQNQQSLQNNLFQPQQQNQQSQQNNFQPQNQQLLQTQRPLLTDPQNQQTTTQQQQLQQYQNYFRPRPPPPPGQGNGIDEDESEEADTDVDIDTDTDDSRSRQQRQLNILANLFPTILGGSNRNQNNNNNNNNQNNNNANTVPQSPAQNVPQQPTDQQQQQQQQQQQPQPPNNNNNNNQNNNNMNQFDLNQFAQNLSRGIGDVARVLPDLFRGAREGLQLIQALSGILRAFPGLADIIPF